MWFFALLFVGSIVASLLLAPKPKIENARASNLSDLSFPRATEDAVVPLGLGRFRAKGPNTIWVDDWEARPIKKKQKTGLFSSKRVIVGYEYFVGVALAICLGPDCKLFKIWYGKDVLWEGEVSADGTAIAINLPNLFGGKEKGGGFVGTIRFYSGSFTQGVNPYMEGVVGVDDVTAYRGTCYVVFEHCNIGENNSLRDISFEISRYTNGLALAGDHHLIGLDLNPMELLYQLWTMEYGGLQVPTDFINYDLFQELAETVYDEGNGMSLLIGTANDGKDLSNEVLRQVDGLLYQDPPTGKIVPKLIRADYDVDDLQVFDESNILVIRNYTSKLWEDTFNQLRVKFTNREKKYETSPAMEQDLANISAQERIRSSTQSYPGVMTGELAQIIAKRDLAQMSVPLLAANIEFNREAVNLRPGSVFLWSWDAFGIEQVVMRIKSFDLGALADNRIVAECNQDQFAVAQTVFADASNGGTNPAGDDQAAEESDNVFVLEAPYFYANASGIALGSDKAIILVSASAPVGSNEYDVFTSIDTTTYTASKENVVYVPFGTLETTIAASDNLSTGTLAYDLDITLGLNVDVTDFEDFGASDVAQGFGMLVIGSEIFGHEGFTDNADGTITVATVWRALLDTAPSAHAIGADVFFIRGDNVVDDQFFHTDAVRVKVTPRTYADALDPADAAYATLALKKRAARPLRPRNVKFDGGTAFAPPALGTGSKTVTWANADRTSLTVRKLNDNANEYEAGQRTVFRYRLNAGAWVEALIDPGVATYTFNAGAGGGDTVDYEIYSTRDSLDSFSKWTFTAGASAGAGSSPDTGGPSPADTNDEYVAPPDALSIVFPFGETIGTYPIDIPITFDIELEDNFAGINVDVRDNPADGTAVFTVYKTGVSVGTVSITTGGVVTANTTGAGVALANGDSLSVEPPASEDSAMAGVTITFAANRG